MVLTNLVLFISAAVVQAAISSAYGCGAQHNGTLNWTEALAMAEAFTVKLTLEEKIQMVTGNSSANSCIGNIAPVPRLGFGGICLVDGPSAINRADGVSVFPSGITSAATWDKKLIYRRGFALGVESKGYGAHVLLGPSTNPMGRHALGGRNWEGFGPDPYLAGLAMESSIHGMQDAGVQSCSKHYIANEQETQRSNDPDPFGNPVLGISSNVDDRTLHELYLWPFANAVRAGTTSIMCSYNRVNQTYACENEYLMKDVLRDELGFKGYVVSDWFATHSTAESINAGLDVEMPGPVLSRPESPSFFGKKIDAAMKEGLISEDRLDEMVRNVMAPYYYLGQDTPDYPTVDPAGRFGMVATEIGIPQAMAAGMLPKDVVFPRGRNNRRNHAKLIREMGSAGTVLLKNVNNTLPIKAPKVIGVFGNDAADPTQGFYRRTSQPSDVNTGTMVIGGGSGTARLPYVIAPLEAIKARARETDAEVLYITDNKALAANYFHGVYPPPEICFVFQQTFASESFDRTDFELDGNSTQVIKNVANFCANTVVITHSGGVNTMPWADHPKIGAILAAHYPGQETGNSIVDLLWGDVAPSGRLPYTIPREAKDAGPPIVNLTYPLPSPDAYQADFVEGQLLDYRHYDALEIDPLYEFGFGLTYTTFAIDEVVSAAHVGNSSLSARPDARKETSPGGNPDLWEEVVVVSAKISNTGDRAAHAVPQLYLSFPASAPEGTPVKVLRGFEKILLEADAETAVEFSLMRRDVSYWDTGLRDWVIPKGEFTFRVGFSSMDLPAETTFAVLK
ncbi:hypothetical protein D7B24_003052 [Verticillium nonalfalfae]|uniref:Beta-glucosidase cel3A n=1 Tax=Verticillium nonalfalfae TaxID=1051616 RepID=A0A3M9YHP6_9PEZI|nr:uncharacterized protein D7B24_003052 [Verticillium nonalfalfae]RNJ59296.1 hypothetical protein D7B24_003052 [Verticillium nonalfalfae]